MTAPPCGCGIPRRGPIVDKFARFSINNTRFTILWLVAAVIGGTSTYFTLPNQEDPEIELRGAHVSAQFPGMSPGQIEKLLVQPIEEAVKKIPEVETISSVALPGVAIVATGSGGRIFGSGTHLGRSPK